jgi:hypothetical protein
MVSTGAYTVSAGGENRLGSADAFHFVWQKAAADNLITAGIETPGAGPHEKAVLKMAHSYPSSEIF